MTFLLFIGGLVLLILGAEAVVKGASRIASVAGISPLVVGLTVVAFGTSSPELAVSIKSAYAGQAQIAIGNIIGSNIFNVLFILGISALITPLAVARKLIRVDVPLMIVASVLVLIFALDGVINRLEGTVFVVILIVYTTFLIYESRGEATGIIEEYTREFGVESANKHKSLITNSVLILTGLGMLILGSDWLVTSAVSIARILGISELIIGLTIIAVGTSLPEVVTSIIASVRGERDIAVGNIIGSNLFNILCVLGISSLVSPAGIEIDDSIIRFDLPVMIAVAFACLPVFFTQGEISRWEGGLLFSYYIIYTVYLILSATKHLALPLLAAAMLYFVLPLTAITLAVITIRYFRDNQVQEKINPDPLTGNEEK
jgi:cation:H+ antiporter